MKYFPLSICYSCFLATKRYRRSDSWNQQYMGGIIGADIFDWILHSGQLAVVVLKNVPAVNSSYLTNVFVTICLLFIILSLPPASSFWHRVRLTLLFTSCPGPPSDNAFFFDLSSSPSILAWTSDIPLHILFFLNFSHHPLCFLLGCTIFLSSPHAQSAPLVETYRCFFLVLDFI